MNYTEYTYAVKNKVMVKKQPMDLSEFAIPAKIFGDKLYPSIEAKI